MRATTLGADFAPPQEIAFGDDADRSSLPINHRKTANVVAQHRA